MRPLLSIRQTQKVSFSSQFIKCATGVAPSTKFLVFRGVSDSLGFQNLYEVTSKNRKYLPNHLHGFPRVYGRDSRGIARPGVPR